MAKKHDLRRRERKESLARKEIPLPPQAARATAATGRQAGRGVVAAICLLLVLGAALVFVQTASHQFVNCDDNDYIYDNINIQRGLNLTSARWAITQAHSANWHPLTWMSHALDWQLFGKWDPVLNRYADSWPGGHHLVNLALHAICSVLLFLVLQAMTGTTWPSAVVAALFAIHPLHVESVAWATGRKDTLSALFFLLTLAAYRAYAVRDFSWWRYGLVAASFALGLMAKPMLVTVPFVLLLLDYWPLRRIAPGLAPKASPPRWFTGPAYVWLIVEKLPLLALAAASSRLTMWAQGLVAAFKPLAVQYRVGNALVSYAAYIRQMFWPTDMVVQYFHKGPTLRVEDTLAPLELLAAITFAAIWFGLRRRYLFVGWFWYLGMLVPVIGLVQVGAQARADRYTYLTQIGLYIMIAWGLADLARGRRGRSALYAALGVPALAALAAVAWLQTTHWQDSLTLWTHCAACEPNNDFAQNSLGNALNSAGRVEEANDCYRRSFQKNRNYLAPYCSLAGNLYKQGKAAEVQLLQQGKPEEARRTCDEKMREAVEVCDAALEVANNEQADDAQIHFLKAVALHGSGRVDQAIAEFHVALEKNPKNPDAHNDLAEVLRAKNQLDDAGNESRAALELRWEFPEAHRTLGNILLAQGNPAGAEEEFRIALKLKPNDPAALACLSETHRAQADALWRQGKFREAVEQRKKQVASQPQDVAAAVEVVRGLINDPRPEARFGPEAQEIARALCEATEYKNMFALDVLAAAYAETGDFPQAEAAIRKAMETMLGQSPGNAAALQQRLGAYRAHRKPLIPPSKP